MTENLEHKMTAVKTKVDKPKPSVDIKETSLVNLDNSGFYHTPIKMTSSPFTLSFECKEVPTLSKYTIPATTIRGSLPSVLKITASTPGPSNSLFNSLPIGNFHSWLVTLI